MNKRKNSKTPPVKVKMSYMAFGKYRAGMSDEEFRQLENAFKRYLAMNGTGFGFVFYLLGGCK